MENKKMLERLMSCIIEQLPFNKFLIDKKVEFDGRTYYNVMLNTENRIVPPVSETLKEKLRKIFGWIHREYSSLLVSFYVNNLFICGDRIPEYTQAEWGCDWNTDSNDSYDSYTVSSDEIILHDK